MLTACFVITAVLLPSYVVTIVVSVETMHDSFLFPASEVQAPVSLILCHFLFFRVNIEVYQTQYSPTSLNFSEIHCHHLKMVHFDALLSAKLSIAFNFMSSAANYPFEYSYCADFTALPNTLAFSQLHLNCFI